jgi:hypothetical protein
MVLKEGSEPARDGAPDDYLADHAEDPRQWGWHAEWGDGSRVGGWVVVAILLLMTTATNYQLEYHITLWLAAALLAGVLLLDRRRRKNSWRS